MRSEYHEGLDRDQAVQISSLSCGESSLYVTERNLYSVRSLISFSPFQKSVSQKEPAAGDTA